MRALRRSGKFSNDVLNKYIKTLQARRDDIVTRIDEIAFKILGEDQTSSLKQVYQKIAALNEIDQKIQISEGKMQATLQSYDLHANEKYLRL